MNLRDNATGQAGRRNHSLTALSIVFCVVALSAGVFLLPELKTPVVSAAPLLSTPVEPGATTDIAPSAVIHPDGDLSETDRELLAFRAHGG
jgi:hypothetical protein